MRRLRGVAVPSLIVAFLLLGCDSEPETWAELDHEERVTYMSEVVTPAMRDIFQAHDPDRYAGFSCQTCHGENASEVDYAMPNGLTPLPMEGTLEAAEAIDAAETAFMLDEVFPKMVELLDYEKYNEVSAPDGFRCVGCHRVAE